jgi:WD40 repeat protein
MVYRKKWFIFFEFILLLTHDQITPMKRPASPYVPNINHESLSAPACKKFQYETPELITKSMSRFISLLYDKKEVNLLTILPTDLQKVILKNNIFRFWFQKNSIDCESPVLSIAISPDNQTLGVGCRDDKTRIFSRETLKRTHTLDHGNTVQTIAFSRNGKMLATGCHDDIVRIFSVPTWELIKQLRGNEFGSATVAFSPKEDVLATGFHNYKVCTFDTTTWNATRELKGEGTVYSLAFSPDGSILAASWSHTSIDIFSTTTWSLIKTLELGTQTSSVAFSPHGKLLAVGCCDVYILDTRTWQYTQILSVNPYSTKALSTVGALLGIMKPNSVSCNNVAFSPDGKTLVITWYDGKVRTYDTKTWYPIQEFIHTKNNSLISLAFSLNSNMFATGCDNKVRIYEQYSVQNLDELILLRMIYLWLAVAKHLKTITTYQHMLEDISHMFCVQGEKTAQHEESIHPDVINTWNSLHTSIQNFIWNKCNCTIKTYGKEQNEK